MPIRLHVLGALAINGGAGSEAADLIAQPKAMALFLYLVLARPRGFHRRDRLLAMLWPDLDQERARAALRKTLQRIREAAGESAVVTKGSEAVAAATDVACDALDFDRAISDGTLGEALDTYGGELLPGFHVNEANGGGFGAWLEQERVHYRERAVATAWQLVERFAADGQFTNASRLARRVARMSPTDERMLRRVLTMLARLGDRAGAMDVYARFEKELWREFDMAPSPETQHLVRAIQRGAAV